MINKNRIVARLRRYHVELDDDLDGLLQQPHVRHQHSKQEIILLSNFNSVCRRLNSAYANKTPNHAHIGRALRDASKLITDIEKHRVARYMPQGVEDVPRSRPRQVSTEQLM